MNGGNWMIYRKRTVLGLILLFLIVFAVYSCLVIYGIRRKEPSKAKLVITETVEHKGYGDGI
jgi:hypothetical protein